MRLKVICLILIASVHATNTTDETKRNDHSRVLKTIHEVIGAPALTFDLLPSANKWQKLVNTKQSYVHWNRDGKWKKVNCIHSKRGPKLQVLEGSALRDQNSKCGSQLIEALQGLGTHGLKRSDTLVKKPDSSKFSNVYTNSDEVKAKKKVKKKKKTKVKDDESAIDEELDDLAKNLALKSPDESSVDEEYVEKLNVGKFTTTNKGDARETTELTTEMTSEVCNSFFPFNDVTKNSNFAPTEVDPILHSYLGKVDYPNELSHYYRPFNPKEPDMINFSNMLEPRGSKSSNEHNLFIQSIFPREQFLQEDIFGGSGAKQESQELGSRPEDKRKFLTVEY